MRQSTLLCPARATTLAALCAFVLGSVATSPLGAQDASAASGDDTPADARQEQNDRALTRTRQMLEQRPTHAALFDRYFKLLVERNSIDAEVEALRTRLAEDEDPGVSVVLGRLLLRAGKEEAALEVLDGIPSDDPKIQGVLGDIYFKLARFDAAVRAFRAALPGARISEEKRVLYERLGRAELALGQKQQAIATWDEIGKLDAGKFYRRLYVAELLADNGLLDEAAARYAPLLAETESDPPRHCQVLRDVGRLQELQGELETALATYEDVLARTGRGNWLRKEVEKRVVQIYRRTGRLDDLVTRLEKETAENPNDLAVAELLANVLIEMRELDRAVATLAALTPRFPKDVRLSRRLAQLHVEQKDIDAAIAEYQRILLHRPDELDLYIEVGTLFARGDRFAEAKNQWEKALAKRLDDASLCSRLAAMYALWGQVDDAVRLYQRAIELEPESMVRYVDTAEYLFAQRRRDEAIAVLDDALARADGKPRRLELLAGPCREHELLDRAERCLRGILAVETANQEVRYALADLLLVRDRGDEAVGLLWDVVDADDRGSGHRTMSANTLVNLAARARKLPDLLTEAESRDSAGAAFVAGRAYSRLREFDKAIAAYRLALTRKPADLESRRLLARLYAEEGNYQKALDEYEQLGVVAPGERRRNFREIARLQMELYELDAAVETWRVAMRDNPDNPSVFLQVGKEFLEINRVQEALEAFEQAARLRPNDPETLLRLGGAMRQAGKHDEAEEHLLKVASGAVDSRDREHARRKLFELYAEQGAIDTKIETLQATIAENPYDADAPQLLADLYKRTGDFVLGLEMVERAVKFQPRNEELLSRQAELLEELEEWEKARDVHAELIKFPDADRDRHLAGMGQALFEMGKADDAKEVFRKIQDRGRLRRVYEQYRLYDEAIEYYRRAVARNPSDVRSYYYLAEQLEKRAERDEAIRILERALNLRPYYQQALRLVGKLYVQDGRRDEAVKVGMRLFGLRGEQVEKNRHEEAEEEEQRSRRYWYRSRSRTRPFSQRRLDAASGYFSERGLEDEWGDILVAEARRRPTDVTLYGAVQSYYKWEERSAGKFSAFVRELLDADWTRVRVPPGYTKRSYRQKLESDLIRIWREDASVAEARLAELDGPDPTAMRLVERAKVEQAIGKLDEMRTHLTAAIELDAENPVARQLLVEACVEQKDYAAALPHLVALVDWWEGPGKAWDDELAARREASFQTSRKGMLDALPRRIRRRVDSDDLRAVLARVRTSSFSKLTSISFPESVSSRFACVVKLIRTAKAAADDAVLQTAVERAETIATTLGERGSLGRVLFQEGMKERARALLAGVVDEASELEKDPIQVYFWDRYGRVVNTAAEPLGDILAESGDVLGAYAMLRNHGHGQKAELLLKTGDNATAVVARLESNAAAEGETLAAARAEGSGEIRSRELDYRDAVIKLADYWVGEKDYQKAEDIYVGSLTLLPDDIEVRTVVAKLRERRGDTDAAIAMQREIIDVKRRRKRAAAGDTAPPPTRLQPTLPDSAPDESGQFGVSRVAYSSFGGSYFYSTSSWSRSNRFEVSSNYNEILRIHSSRNDHEGVLDTLRLIMQEDPAAFRRMAWQVLDTLRNQDLGKKKLPVLRILKGVVKDDEWLTMEYARACREEGELKEARRTLEKFIAKNMAQGNWYVENAEEELERVLQKMGEYDVSIDTLRAAVDEEPDNVRHRMRLARRLKEEHRYAEALEQARVIAEKAPYMTLAKDMVVEAAAAAREDDEAIAMLRDVFDESTNTSDKLRRGVTLANWLYAGGDEGEAVEIVDGLETTSGGSQYFSAGNWFLDKNRMAEALVHYAREIEKNKANQWRLEDIRARVARLEMSQGKEVEAVGRHLEALDEATSLEDRESKWKELLRALKGHPNPSELRAKLEPVHGARETVESRLVMAGVGFAEGDADAALLDVAGAIEASPKEVYLYPMLLGFRRLEDDYDGALSVLERMGREYGGSDSMQWQGGFSISERDRLKLVRAEILETAGREGEAEELLTSILDETVVSSYLTLANIYKQRKDWEKALEWRRLYSEKVGTKQRADLVEEATILLEIDRIDEALALVEEAYVMARGDSTTRDMLIKIHRERGTLDEVIQRLEAEFAKDFRDSGLRSTLLTLYSETERVEDRRGIYERMAKEEDLKQSALNSLASMASEDGDYDAQLGYLNELLELKGGDEKKSLQKRIAGILAERDDLEQADAVFRESVDLETADGQLAYGRWLQSNELDERAFAAFERVLEMDRDNEGVLLPLIESAWKDRRFDAVLDRVVDYLDKTRGKSKIFSGRLHTWVLDALAGVDDAKRARVLAGDVDGEAADESAVREALELACVAHLALADFTAAERAAAALLAKHPESFVGLEARMEALRHQDRPEELYAAIESMREAVERAYVVNDDWDYYSRAQSLQNELGRILHGLGQDDRADEVWRMPALRRTPYSNPFSYYRSDWGVRYTAELWLGVRRPQLALTALEREFLLREDAPWSSYTKALRELGRLDEVEAFAWKRFLDPLELYGISSGDYGWIWVGGQYRQASGMQEFLVDFYRKQNRIDELRAKAEELAAVPTTRRQARDLLEAIARVEKNHLAIAQREEERKLGNGGSIDDLNARDLYALAKLWHEADDVDKALRYMARLVDFDSPALKRSIRPKNTTSWRRYSSNDASEKNPFAFSFADSGVSYWWSSGSRGNLREHREVCAALLWRKGDAAKAQEIEDDLLDQPTPKRRKARAKTLASNYLRYKAHDQAARLYRTILAEESGYDLEDEERTSMLQSLARAQDKVGDEDGRRATLGERRRLLEARLADAPGPHAFSLRRTLANLLLFELDDADAAQEHIDFLLRYQPRNRSTLALRCRVQMMQGQVDDAIRGLRELSELRRRNGEDDQLREQVWLGLALHASGAADDAREVLRQVVLRMSDEDPLHDDVVAALATSR